MKFSNVTGAPIKGGLRIAAAALAGAAAMLASSGVGATVYTVNETIGAGSVTGFIETDGTIGAVDVSEIVDWSLQLNNDGVIVDLFGPDSGDNSVFGLIGAVFQASATELTYQISGGVAGFQFCLEAAGYPNVCNLGLPNWVVFGTNSFQEQIRDISGKPNQTYGPVGAAGDIVVIGVASGGQPPEVPLPAAAWLFLSGVAGLFGRAAAKRRAAS